MLERASNLAESRKVWEIDVCDYDSGSRVEQVGIEGDTIANKTAMGEVSISTIQRFRSENW